MTTYTKERILIIFTGGTVAGKISKAKTIKDENLFKNSFIDILENTINIERANFDIDISCSTEELFNIDSSNIQPENWERIIEKIQEKYDDFDSFIILHGTNTMGYTSAALSFALENINKPIIITGSQVPLGYLGSDAEINLVNAIRVAIWKHNEIKGVIAVFGSKIISGTRVKKGTDFDYDPFKSFQTGTLGEIGRFIKINKSSLKKHVSYLSKNNPLATQSNDLHIIKNFDTRSIASLTEFPGMNKNIFKALVENNGIKAFVLRTFGAGDPSAHLFPAFEYLRKNQIPIVVTTQAPGGVSNFQVNETGQYLKKHDLAIPAYDMSIESMTVKMGWLLAQKLSYEQIKLKMLEDLHGEVNIHDELL